MSLLVVFGPPPSIWPPFKKECQILAVHASQTKKAFALSGRALVFCKRFSSDHSAFGKSAAEKAEILGSLRKRPLQPKSAFLKNSTKICFYS